MSTSKSDYSAREALFLQGRPMHTELTDEDYRGLAGLLEVEVAALKAVKQVESGGRKGLLIPGRPPILFEGHVFWRELKKRGIDPAPLAAGREDILYPGWTKQYYKGGVAEYDRLERARALHREAADASTSWGLFQLMGFNYAVCGMPSVRSFVELMCQGELGQMCLLGRFLYLPESVAAGRTPMLLALRKCDWARFAELYNGPGYRQNRYDEKLEAAYRRFVGE